ncbi:Sensor protein FixL [Planctomycetes bacterium CA13]|uniref:Sensor protein FixL n=1 Tax=Novipirellula herctigrandis TaxID=2527986 RepID=A0A5C5Z8C5_9BACT|nr:Sensor protein FixL [Planctomycetes bacterium CA13]
MTKNLQPKNLRKTDSAVGREIFRELTNEFVLREFAPATVLINQRFEVLYGMGPLAKYLEVPTRELTGNISVVARPELREKLLAACSQSIRENGLVSDSCARVNRDGMLVHCTLTVRPVTAPPEAKGLMLVTFADQTVGQSPQLETTVDGIGGVKEERQTPTEDIISMNEELETLRGRSRAILASLSAHIAVVDRDGVIVAVNPAWKRFADQNFGTEEQCGVGSNYLDVCVNASDNHGSGGDATQVVTKLRQLLAGTIDEFTMEYPCHSVTEKRWFIMHATPLDYEQRGAVISHINITERKQAEIALQESEQRLRAILDTASDSIVTIDHQGKIECVNHATELMFGYDKEEIIGQNVAVLMPQAHREKHDDHIRHYLDTGVAKVVNSFREVVAFRKDGSTIPIEIALSEVDGLNLFTGILRDITEKKRLEERILQTATDEQQRIGQELHDGTQQELTGLSLFLGTVLSILDNASQHNSGERVTWRLTDDDFSMLQQTISKLTDRLKETIQHVRELSHGIMPVQIDNEGLRSALADLAATNDSQKHFSCRFISSGDITISSNTIANQLYRIAQEALSNALRHANADHVLISLKGENNTIVLEISDNGVGIDSSISDRLGTASAGFGLRIMSYRANSIGGVFHIERNGDRGTMVRCAVPVQGYQNDDT